MKKALIFKFCQAVPDILNLVLRKKDFFRQDLKETYTSRMSS